MELNLKKYHDEMVQELQKLVSYKTVLDTPVENGPFGKGNKECGCPGRRYGIRD